MYRTVTYEQVKHTEKKVGKCQVCGKITTRSKTFTNTINPFNKDENGNVKTYPRVLDDVIEKGRLWTPDFTCRGCK